MSIILSHLPPPLPTHSVPKKSSEKFKHSTKDEPSKKQTLRGRTHAASSQPFGHAEGRVRPHAASRWPFRKNDAGWINSQGQRCLKRNDGLPCFRKHGSRSGKRRVRNQTSTTREVDARDLPRPCSRRSGGGWKCRVDWNGIDEATRLPEASRNGLVAHKRRIMRKEIGRLAFKKAFDSSTTAIKTHRGIAHNTIIDIAFKVFKHPTKAQGRFG